MSLKDKIINASYLYLLIHFTTNGFMCGFDQAVSKSFLSNINNRFGDIRTISNALRNKHNRFDYTDKSWLNYISSFISDKRALAILDVPYIHALGFPCYDYDKNHPFTWKDVKAFLKPFKGARCKCIMFCSDNLEFEKAAIAAGFKKSRYYDDCGYRTIIYTLNISDDEAEKAFINLGRF